MRAIAGSASDNVELFELERRSALATLMRRANLGRRLLLFLARLKLFSFDNDAALRRGVNAIPPAVGHVSVEDAQCPAEKAAYTKRITRALLNQIKDLALSNVSKFVVVRSIFQRRSVLCAAEYPSVSIMICFARLLIGRKKSIFEIPIEVGRHGMSSITVDQRSDSHLNLFGNKLVMESLADMIDLQ
jgi:hypothetical protein